MGPQQQDTTDYGAAIVAHGLLTSMAVVSGGLRTLFDHWSDLSPGARDHLVERILAHSGIVSDGLRDLTRGMPEGTRDELDAMQRHRPPSPGAPRQ